MRCFFGSNDLIMFCLIFLQIDEDSLIYAAPNFISKSGRSVRRAASAGEAESIYSDVRYTEGDI